MKPYRIPSVLFCLFTTVALPAWSLAEGPIQATNDINIPIILPTQRVHEWLQKDPTMNASQSAFDAAKADAEQSALSSYEWTTQLTQQQRDYGTGAKSDEWNIGIERTFRLPGKSRADKSSASAAKMAACAVHVIDKHAAATNLIDSYLDWQAARSGKTLLIAQQQLAQRSADVVSKRVRSGDASMLEQKLALAEILDVQRQSSDADFNASSTWAQFVSRYPTNVADMPTLPDPVSIVHEADWWLRRIITSSDQLNARRANYKAAQARLDRADSDRIPDPTVGVFTGREAYGDEKIVGINFSMPIPGGRRNLEKQKQLAQSNRAYQDMLLAEQQLNSDAQTIYRHATGHYQRWTLAHSTLLTLRDNATLGQRAYELGEQDLQTLLLAQRQGLVAAQAEVEARIDALRSYYKLLLAAKLLWPELLDNTPAECNS